MIDGMWNEMTHFHLSQNRLSGSIPAGWKSPETSRPLQYFNVYDNQLTGTIPESLRLRKMIYFDVGRNLLDGTLPDDVGQRFVELRHLLIDWNKFNGTLQASYINVGNGRLQTLRVDHNQLSGEVPSYHEIRDQLVQYTLHNNSFTKLDKDTCRLGVFDGGEMVEFNADCDICICDPFCPIHGCQR